MPTWVTPPPPMMRRIGCTREKKMREKNVLSDISLEITFSRLSFIDIAVQVVSWLISQKISFSLLFFKSIITPSLSVITQSIKYGEIISPHNMIIIYRWLSFPPQLKPLALYPLLPIDFMQINFYKLLLQIINVCVTFSLPQLQLDRHHFVGYNGFLLSVSSSLNHCHMSVPPTGPVIPLGNSNSADMC